MSRRTRPQRRIRGRERETLRTGFSPLFLAQLGASGWPGVPTRLAFAAYNLGMCRPAQLRRCLLGRPVSARAAGKILAAVCSHSRREPGR